jgi:Nucleotidyltransferase domain
VAASGAALENGAMLDDDFLTSIGQRLVGVPGVLAVALGGSRARGTHTPTSDIDLGLYYEDEFDRDALISLAQEFGGASATVTAPGEWGPWVDGGGWLDIQGVDVDWIFRDINRVEDSVRAAERGETTRHHQLGHPFGIPEYAYAAEVALSRILADPTGRLGALKDELRDYPAQLSDALVRDLAEADFNIAIARKGLARQDAVYISGCLFQALIVSSNAIHAAAGQWVTNEKGAVARAGELPTAPPGFAERSAQVAGALGTTTEELEQAIESTAAIVAETRDSIAAQALA